MSETSELESRLIRVELQSEHTKTWVESEFSHYVRKGDEVDARIGEMNKKLESIKDVTNDLDARIKEIEIVIKERTRQMNDLYKILVAIFIGIVINLITVLIK